MYVIRIIYVQDEKNSLYQVIMDEFYTSDLMEIHVKNLLQIDLEFQSQHFFLLHYILFSTKKKFFQETIGRNMMILLKNGKKVF